MFYLWIDSKIWNQRDRVSLVLKKILKKKIQNGHFIIFNIRTPLLLFF